MLAKMYITLVPAMIAGILNMVWCKTSFLASLQRPIDKKRTLSDKQRIFGDNKTWKGFWGMLVLGTALNVLWGMLCRSIPYMENHNFFYDRHRNTNGYNLIVGLLVGLSYALCELPNSFVKRRLGIRPGKPPKGWQAPLFIFMDQADSVFGMVAIVALFSPMRPVFYFLYVLLGATTHIVINILLYCVKLRKNPF